ncbi:hypothetical protein GH714_031500 [Hevea brasiliensis]|uniref:Uncharacterized protein n=1 Tax=Hevea brasiliensis TaxID=3981 RepID=A0A6A6M4L1_HEVBR|nr:hypothetical protein GH714_031500 [Hevea brasiliensis]
MAEETSDTMNLDLNLGPGPEAGSGSVPSEAVNLEEWIDDPFERIREAVRISRARHRWRWRQGQIPHETHSLSVELNQLIGNSDSLSTLQAGRVVLLLKKEQMRCPKRVKINGFLEDEVSEKKSDVEKRNDSDGSFFDCNICLDLATDPVVTCCEEDSSIEVPVRPNARRVESWRQSIQRNSFSFPMEEMIRRLGSRFDLTRDLNPVQDSNGTREMGDRTSFLSRIMTLRGMRTEQTPVSPLDDLVDLTQSGTSNPDARSARRPHSLLLRRSQAHSQRSSTHTSNPSAFAERIIEAYLLGRSQEQPQPVDDRDSFSSIAAGINSESQIDTAVEIDSMGSLSTSSSRRRNDTVRVSDVDTGDSRAPRRRRFN